MLGGSIRVALEAADPGYLENGRGYLPHPKWS